MRKRILQPEQILVPGEYSLGNESILKIYHRIFERGHGNCLPPVIVLGKNSVPRKARETIYLESIRKHYSWLKRWFGHSIKDCIEDETLDSMLFKFERALEVGRRFGAENRYASENSYKQITDYFQCIEKFEDKLRSSGYLLLDGNHRTAAATLNHEPISALELQTDEDFTEVRKMVERGELFDFKRPEETIKPLYISFINYIIGSANDRNNHMENLRTVRERIDELTSNGNLPKYIKDRYLAGA